MIDNKQLAAAFTRVFGGGPTLIARAPGRVNLIGEHTDYNGGFVMPCAINRDIRMAARRRTDQRLVLHSVNYSASHEADAARPLRVPKRRGWYSYFLATAAQFQQRGFDLPGLDVAIDGDVPLGSGLSSSAAFEVCAAVLFNELLGSGMPAAELALLAQAAEHSPFVGVRCGIMDQFASALGRADEAILLDCHTHEVSGVPLAPDAFEIVIIDTMKRRGLVDSAYNERRASCEEGLAELRRLAREEYPSLRHVPADAFEALAPALPENVRRRVRHNIGENARVLRFAECARAGDWATAGRLLVESHASLRDDFEVSCAELDAVVEIAGAAEDVLGCRMTGAGFGGCAVAMVAPGAVDAFTARMKREYPARCGMEPVLYVTRAEPGADIHPAG